MKGPFSSVLNDGVTWPVVPSRVKRRNTNAIPFRLMGAEAEALVWVTIPDTQEPVAQVLT